MKEVIRIRRDQQVLHQNLTLLRKSNQPCPFLEHVVFLISAHPNLTNLIHLSLFHLSYSNVQPLATTPLSSGNYITPLSKNWLSSLRLVGCLSYGLDKKIWEIFYLENLEEKFSGLKDSANCGLYSMRATFCSFFSTKNMPRLRNKYGNSSILAPSNLVY